LALGDICGYALLNRTGPISLAGLLELTHMTVEGWAECGGEDCFSVGCDVVFDLLDGFCQLLDQPLA
jgi:hypothetical protein